MNPNDQQNPIPQTPPENLPVMPAAPSDAPAMPTTPNGSQKMPDNGQKKVGPIVATFVIVLILIVAALYLFASRINQQPAVTAPIAAPATTSAQTDQESVQPVTSTSTDVQSIQSDLNTSTTGLDNQNF